MKFAFISLDFRRFPLEFCFECGQYYGFDGVEIWAGRPHAYPDDMSDARLLEIDALKKKHRMEVPMFVPDALNASLRLTSLDEREREQAVRAIKAHIDVAARLECPRVLVVADHPGYNVAEDKVWDAFVDSVRQLTDHARGTGVRVTMEPLCGMESPVVCTTDDCVRLLRAVDAPELHFMMDIVPPTVMFEPFSDYFTKLGARMDYIHICNTDSTVTDAHTRLEDGIIPLEDMFSVFKRWGYNDYISLEIYSEGYRDPELLLANSARVLKGIRERVGV